MMFGVPKEDLFHLVEILVMAGIGVLVLLLVVRPLLNRVLESATALSNAAQENSAAMVGGGGGVAQLASPNFGGSGGFLGGEAEESDALEQMINVGRVEGRVKASSLRKITDIVEKHPEESVAILRNWIYQENR
jgi:flagellar M-ring protein FliF